MGGAWRAGDGHLDAASEAKVLAQLEAQQATLRVTQARAARLSERAERAEREGRLLVISVLAVGVAALLWRRLAK